MIRYGLRCASGHGFEGWFRSSGDYDEQAARGALRCPYCDSAKVDKAIMAPAVNKTRLGEAERAQRDGASPEEGSLLPSGAERSVAQAGVATRLHQGVDPSAAVPGKGAAAGLKPEQAQALARFAQLARAARAVQEHVLTNFENVGQRFADEARAIHDGDAEERGIYGQATAEEVEALAEDGIEIQPLPSLPKLNG